MLCYVAQKTDWFAKIKQEFAQFDLFSFSIKRTNKNTRIETMLLYNKSEEEVTIHLIALIIIYPVRPLR